jgi:2-polyprenyl-3-methyl-5-hydroxy-6-metoxy-1,4-benzoquinol methylase
MSRLNSSWPPPVPPGYLEDQRSLHDDKMRENWAAYQDPVWDASRTFEVQQIFRHVSPRTVLDVGCGCGFHDVVMGGLQGVERVDAFDYSEATIEVAELEYPHPKVRRWVSSIFDEPDGAYDLVVSFQVIEHLRDQAGFLAACARLTRPGGWVAVATPNRLRFDNRVRRAFGRHELVVDDTHFRELSRLELTAMAHDVGLMPRATFGYGLSVIVPRLNRQIVPRMAGVRLGSRVPPIANVFVTVFDRRP